MNLLADFIQVRKNTISFIVLVLLILGIPLAVYLVQQSQQFFSKAAGETIALAEGACIKTVNGKKSAICSLIPLNLLIPFSPSPPPTPSRTPSVSVRPSASPSPGASAQPSSQASVTPSSSSNSTPSPSPSPSSNGNPQFVNVKSFNNDINAAVSSIRATGGGVYVPAGTYQLDENISLSSNTTLFGDGSSTVIKINGQDNGITNKASEAEGDTNIVIRDLKLVGAGGGIGTGGCCYGIRFRNIRNSYIINVTVENFSLDGITLTYKHVSGEPVGADNIRVSGCNVKGNKRQQISIIHGSGNVIDNCKTDGTGADGLWSGIDLEPDSSDTAANDNRILDNEVIKSNNGITLNGVRGESRTVETIKNNAVCNNKVNTPSVPLSDSGRGNIWVSNTGGTVEKIEARDSKTGPSSACNIPSGLSTLPSAPQKPQAFINTTGDLASRFFEALIQLTEPLIKKVSAVDSTGSSQPGTTECSDNRDNDGDDKVDEEDPHCHTDGNPLNEDTYDGTIKYEFYAYRLAESEAKLKDAQWQIFSTDTGNQNSNTIVSNFKLPNENPGVKQIWVEYRDVNDKRYKDYLTFELLEKAPEISGVACTLDLTKQNIKMVLSGNHFGERQSKIAVNGNVVEVLSWNGNQVTALYKGTVSDENSQYKVKVVRNDTLESPEQICRVDTSLLSLGARVFCREEGQLDVAGVKVTIFSTTGADKLDKVEETVSIDKNGIVQGLKTKLQAGRQYGISIKAPNSLRRNAVFTAADGTTVVTASDGKPFVLPIGDIAPVQLFDGKINSLDMAELIRQWKILSNSDRVLSADFNKDKRVNSIDWACMRYDFESSDETLPDPSQSAPLEIIFNTQNQQTNNASPNATSSAQQSQGSRIYTTPAE